MTKPTDYPTAIKAFVSRYAWTHEILYSPAVIDIAVQFLKMPELVRKDIRRLFRAQIRPPATMMNVALSYEPLRRATAHRALSAGTSYPTEPTRPRRR
jgi:hypothetical protein